MGKLKFWKLTVLAFVLPTISACGVSDFAAQQAAWNRQIGMGGMNATPNMPAAGTVSDEDATRARIKFGEDVENAEAQKAAAAPPITAGMNCTTNGSYSGSANAGTSTSVTTCH